MAKDRKYIKTIQMPGSTADTTSVLYVRDIEAPKSINGYTVKEDKDSELYGKVYKTLEDGTEVEVTFANEPLSEADLNNLFGL